MLTVERAILIINSLKVCLMLGKNTTRHAIAKNINSVSRSTVYRATSRMFDIGLLGASPNENGDYVFYITLAGYELIDSQKELI